MDDLHEIPGFDYGVPSTISIGVIGVIVKKDQVLLVHNSKRDYWGFPGGHLHGNESPEAAARREVLEETGKEFKIKAGPVFYHYKFENKTHAFLLLYLGELVNDNGKYPTLEAVTDGIAWYPVDRLPQKIYENTVPVLEYFKKSGGF